jgi:hypothetical protein
VQPLGEFLDAQPQVLVALLGNVHDGDAVGLGVGLGR